MISVGTPAYLTLARLQSQFNTANQDHEPRAGTEPETNDGDRLTLSPAAMLDLEQTESQDSGASDAVAPATITCDFDPWE